MNRSAIGKRIQQYREASEISQEQLAEIVGLSSVFISAMERGIKSPSLETFIKIANALDISADLLLADVLKNAYKVQTSILLKHIETLSPPDRKKVFDVVAALFPLSS